MNRNLLSLAAILLLQTGCSVSFNLGGSEQKLITSAEENGPETTTFAPEDKTFHARASTFEAKKIEVVWVAESGEGLDQEYEIDRLTLRPNGAQDMFHSHLTRASDRWPEGTYRVDLYRDNEPPESVRFKVASSET